MDKSGAEKMFEKSSGRKEIKPNTGCLLGGLLLGLVILVLLGVLVSVVYLRPVSIMRYSMVTSIQNMEKKLEQERTLPEDQYQELKIYLRSVKKFIIENKIDKSVLKQVRPVNQTFEAAFRDGLVGRSEMMAIRSAMWQSNVPLDVPPSSENQKPSSEVPGSP